MTSVARGFVCLAAWAALVAVVFVVKRSTGGLLASQFVVLAAIVLALAFWDNWPDPPPAPPTDEPAET